MNERCIWIDEGHDVEKDKLIAHEIYYPYFSHRDSRVTNDYLKGVVAQGFSPGIYTAWNWYNLDPVSYAIKIDNELRRIGFGGNPPVCIDIEIHDPHYLTTFFAKWRQIRPTRKTYFTFEGFQGGLLGPVIPELLTRNLYFVPQLYRGDMSPLEHSPMIDLLMYGIPGNLLHGFYDAAALPSVWRGFAFTQERLP